ncbi:sugar phosphate isomerase/epimerase [Gemmiger formicilis]|uniref:sugar phosphate isomerase/epimerase family protein n=1 Tax=Gemmiger formicilis TaxID=745368 RepID=UPI001956EFEC|nr:sugar phosphate isomerase/epimerase family protein [Gemmiger formicilis]MBM6715425.1 sugar phosphate isomerase/epimerase [Gemmiger formicilis]
MATFLIGARLHDYGQGTPDELFARAAADGFAAVQLAYKKCVPGVKSYADVTPQLVADTVEAGKRHHIQVAVLGTYVELALDDEAKRTANAADFKSQLAVCKALGAGCIGTETTNMALQPAGTTRERAQYLLCKSLETILPEAERLGVTVGIEPVSYHSMNTPEATRRILDTMASPALKVIFDAGNLLTADAVAHQDQLWDRVGSLLGDRLVAVHFKGETFTPEGKPQSTSLEESVIDFSGAFRMLRALPQTLPVLREEAVPARAASDIALIRQYFEE